MAIMEYFRVNGYNLVYGSLRLDPPMHQLVFIKLLALCSISRVPGTVCLSAGVPYPAEVLASTIGVDAPTLQAALTHHAEPGTDRIHINDWGGIEIVNWATYQSKSYIRVRQFRARKKAEKDADVTECNAAVTANKREKRKEKYTKEKRSERKKNRKEEKSEEEHAHRTKQPTIYVFQSLFFTVTESRDQKYAAAYPCLDRQAEYRKMVAWLESNPMKRPRKSYPRFVNNWLSRASENLPKETPKPESIKDFGCHR